jgi:hypothetical protein
MRRAYQRGRRDERARARGARRRGSWLAKGLVLLVACFSILVVALAVHEGSFARGGQLIDRSIADASSSAVRTTKLAQARAGQAMQQAGDRLQHSGAAHG